MSDYRKQHIISQTYLKHFSNKSDGIGIFVIDREAKYKKGIQKKNSGDKIFWISNYSDSSFFDDRKAIEKMFGNDIENTYNKIISTIEQDNSNIDFIIKQELLQWIFYTKMRSPIWSNHLVNFTDYNHFKKEAEDFVIKAVNMRWTIYKSPENKYWWTSDNPGFVHNLEKLTTEPIYNNLGVDSVLFYPLSKKYCLMIYSYHQGEDLNLNATNTIVNYLQADLLLFDLLNCSTFKTRKKMIISSERESLKLIVEKKICNQ